MSTPPLVGISAWFVGNDIPGSDNDPIGDWNKRLGTAGNLSTATAGRKPLLKKGVNGIGGHSALLFDGSDDELVGGSYGNYWGNNNKLGGIAIEAGADPGSNAIWPVFSENPPASFHSLALERTGGNLVVRLRNNDGATDDIQSQTLTYATAYVVIWYHSNDGIFVEVSSAAQDFATVTTASASTTTMANNAIMGAQWSGAPASNLQFKVGELLIYSSFDASKKNAVKSYLIDKYLRPVVVPGLEEARFEGSILLRDRSRVVLGLRTTRKLAALDMEIYDRAAVSHHLIPAADAPAHHLRVWERTPMRLQSYTVRFGARMVLQQLVWLTHLLVCVADAGTGPFTQVNGDADGVLRLHAGARTFERNTLAWADDGGSEPGAETYRGVFGAEEVFSDGSELANVDFSGGTLTGWTTVDEGDQNTPSSWSAASFRAVQSSSISDLPNDRDTLPKLGTYIKYDAGSSWTNYRATLTIQSGTTGSIGVMFRYSNASNYVRFHWNKAKKFRRLDQIVAGKFQLLAEDRVEFDTATDYAIQVEAEGQALRVFVDSIQIFSVGTTANSQGTIALYSWQNTDAQFDDVVVTERERIDRPRIVKFLEGFVRYTPRGLLIEASSSGNGLTNPGFADQLTGWTPENTGVNGSAVDAITTDGIFDDEVSQYAMRLTEGNPLPTAGNEVRVISPWSATYPANTKVVFSYDKKDPDNSPIGVRVQREVDSFYFVDNVTGWQSGTNTSFGVAAAEWVREIDTFANTSILIDVGASNTRIRCIFVSKRDVAGARYLIGHAQFEVASYPTSRMLSVSGAEQPRDFEKLVYDNDGGKSWPADHGTGMAEVQFEWRQGDILAVIDDLLPAGAKRTIAYAKRGTDYDWVGYDADNERFFFERKIGVSIWTAFKAQTITEYKSYKFWWRWIGAEGELGLAPYTLQVFVDEVKGTDATATGVHTFSAGDELRRGSSADNSDVMDGFQKNFEVVPLVLTEDELKQRT